MSVKKLRQEARDYYTLCAEAEALGIPTACDDPRSPNTVQDLRDAVRYCSSSRYPLVASDLREGLRYPRRP